MSNKIKFTSFASDPAKDSEFAESTITLDGVRIGTLTRISSDNFESASSFTRVWRPDSYEVVFAPTAPARFHTDDTTTDRDFDARDDARDAHRRAKAWVRDLARV